MFGLVGPIVSKAFGGIVTCLGCRVFYGTDGFDQRGVIVTQGFYHIHRVNLGAIIVLDRGFACDAGDRCQRIAAILANAFGNDIGQSEQFGRVFVKQKVQFAKIWPGDMPVIAFRFKLKREVVSQKAIQAVDQSFLCVIAGHGCFLHQSSLCIFYTRIGLKGFMQ